VGDGQETKEDLTRGVWVGTKQNRLEMTYWGDGRNTGRGWEEDKKAINIKTNLRV